MSASPIDCPITWIRRIKGCLFVSIFRELFSGGPGENVKGHGLRSPRHGTLSIECSLHRRLLVRPVIARTCLAALACSALPGLALMGEQLRWMSALLIRTILTSPISDALPPKTIFANICQLLGHQMPACHPGEQRPVQKELHLRGPAIGQGRRVSCVLGSGTLKSRSRKPWQ